MRHAVLLLLACAACAPHTTTTTVWRRVEAGRGTNPWPGSLADFVPAVPPFEEGGECKVYAEGRERLVTLRFRGPEGAERVVALEVDARGTVRSYSDVRGDLRERGTGPLTSVTVGLENDTGTAMNEHAGARGTPGLTTGRAAEAMELENLGNPRRMLELVKRRCMDARS